MDRIDREYMRQLTQEAREDRINPQKQSIKTDVKNNARSKVYNKNSKKIGI